MDRKRECILATTVMAALLLSSSPALAAPGGESQDEAKFQSQAPLFGPLSDLGETEPNDSPTTANQFRCGDVLRPASLTAGDNDYIVFSANVGDVISFGTDADGTPTVDTFIHLYASDGTTQLASDDDSGPGTFSLLSFTATYTGNYFGRIRGFSATGAGLYKAFVTCSQPPPPTCDIPNYKCDVLVFPTPLPIPDNTAAGVSAGQINTAPDGTRFLDVVFGFRMDHTWIGDLVMILSYDQECDGVAEASARVLCRPGRASCTTGTDFGCSSNFLCNNTMYISDAAANAIGSSPFGCGTSATNLPGACYKGNLTADPLSVFDQFRRGGCWRLQVSDNAGGDLGSLCEWSVCTLNEVIVPVAPTTWSAIKTRITD